MFVHVNGRKVLGKKTGIHLKLQYQYFIFAISYRSLDIRIMFIKYVNTK
jgi:hypothetical protein